MKKHQMEITSGVYAAGANRDPGEKIEVTGSEALLLEGRGLAKRTGKVREVEEPLARTVKIRVLRACVGDRGESLFAGGEPLVTETTARQLVGYGLAEIVEV